MVREGLMAYARNRRATPAGTTQGGSHARPHAAAAAGRRAGAVLVALMVFLWPVLAWAESGRPVLHVFLQLDAKSGAVEKMLQEQLPALGVTVFSRYRDLEDATATGNPDGLLAIPPVLEQRGQKPVLQGTREGKHSEPYLLVWVGSSLDGPLSGKTIGAVDVLGRDGTQSFVARLLKSSDIKVKRVAKTEDLLALLEFSAADGILLPSSALARLSERTRLAIKSRAVPGQVVGLPALAVFNDASKAAIKKCGFRDVAERREHFWHNGRWYGLWEGEITAPEWRSNRAQAMKAVGIKHLDLYCGCASEGFEPEEFD